VPPFAIGIIEVWLKVQTPDTQVACKKPLVAVAGGTYAAPAAGTTVPAYHPHEFGTRAGAVPCPRDKYPALPLPTPVEIPPGVEMLLEESAVMPVTIGEAPAPPPFIKAFNVQRGVLAHVDALEKYGNPPLVPARVKAGVVVGLATEIIPPAKLTLVTVPPAPPPPPSELLVLAEAPFAPYPLTVTVPVPLLLDVVTRT